MNSINSSALALFCTLATMLVAFPTEADAREYRSGRGGEPGRLVIRYSPTLGTYAALAVEIDGRPAGGITRGHTYVAYLPPGTHAITVSRNGREYESSTRLLNVRPGQTYSFLAKYRVNEMILVPAARRSWSGMSARF